MTIIFDVDGVLADFVAGFTKTAGLAEPFGTLNNKSQKWSFADVMDKQLVDATWEKLKNDPEWWYRLPAMVSPTVFAAINDLQSYNHVLFVTARVSYKNAQRQTVQWLIDKGVYCPNVVVSPKKGEIAAAVAADYHIDDKPENAACVHWMADKQPCRSYFLEHPMRRGQWLPDRVRRVSSVAEFIYDIREGK